MKSEKLVVTGSSQGSARRSAKFYRARGWCVVGNAREIKPSDDADYITVPGESATPLLPGKSFKRR